MERAVDTRALQALRRDLKKVAPGVRKQLDRELKTIARGAARKAGELSVKDSGALAAAWKPSLTARNGVSIRNPKVYAGQHEYGRTIVLRRGTPYKSNGGLPPNARGKGGRVVQVDQQRLSGGYVVNVGKYLIKRSQPGRRAVDLTLAAAMGRIDKACRVAADAALS